MRVQHIPVGEAHAFTLIRLCYNCIRAMWRPGGYPPTAAAHALVPGTRCIPPLLFFSNARKDSAASSAACAAFPAA